MIGSEAHRFTGHFDGKGHTLTVNYGSAESPLDAGYVAPFRYVNGGTIKNLHVAGDIYTSAKFAAGIVASQSGDVTIENCRSSVAIHSHTAGDGSHGGLVGLNEKSENSNLTITGCLFDGRLLSEGSTLTTECGGFIGWRAGTATINKSLFDPAEVTIGTDKGATFARNGVDTYNSYFSYMLCDGANNVPALSDGDVNPKKYSNGQQVHPITSSDGVTVAINGDATTTYNVSGLTIYNSCLTRVGASTIIFAIEGNQVQLNLAGSDNGYIVSDGTLTGSANPYTLTMGINTCIMPMPETPTTIASADDWMKFCAVVNSGKESYSGKTVTMTANIGTADNPVTLMAGSHTDHRFKGTFDGGGHTLTFSADNAEASCAPFRYIENATIKNLHTAGTITTSNQMAAGIVAQAKGTCAITNCRSNMEIVSRRNGDGTHGGLIGIIDVGTTTSCTTTIDGCLFYGKLLGSKTNKCGGFVGWTKGHIQQGTSHYYAYVTIKNCLFIPETITIGTNNSATFSRGQEENTQNITVTNSYYSEAFGTRQGNEIVYYTDKKPANIGTEGTFNSVSLITDYTNGLQFGNDEYSYYFMTPEEISLANAADNSSVLSAKDGHFANVTLTGRTLSKSGEWNTLCLPFDVSADQMTETTHPLSGATIKELNTSTSNLDANGTLTLNFTTVTSIEAGKPYIVKWEGASGTVSDPVFNGVTVSKTTPTAVEFSIADSGDKCHFVGQYSPFNIVASGATGNDEGNLNEIIMLGANNTLGYSQNARTLKNFRCHFFVPANGGTAGARRFVMDFGDGVTTGIISIDNGQLIIDNWADAWYSLDGRKLDGKPIAKGVYIQHSAKGRLQGKNGRKVVIK